MTYSILFSSHRLLKALVILGACSIAGAILYPRLAAGWFGAIERHFRNLARNRRRAILAAALFPMVVRVLMLPWYPPPPAQIHDEFSYLLQGDTFAHGRVTNPTPPYWEHFETEYTLFQPTYASQYQPAQGLLLAFGEVVFQNPWWGVWLSVGLMCGALCWALFEIVPPVWALAGALGAALQIGIFGLWMNSYFGGAAAATAGALIVAALARIGRGRKLTGSAALCAFGIILTFATRPFEALLWSGIAAAFCCWYVLKKRWRPRTVFVRLLLPFVLVFGCGASALAWYNWRLTGNPADPPYLAYRRIYGTPQPYWWQPPVTASGFRYAELRDNYLNQLRLYDERDSASALLTAERERTANFWRFFVGPFFTPALLFLPWLLRERRIRPWLFASIPFILAKATFHAWYPAHSAPETILIVLVMLECWRHMRVFRRRGGVGVALSRALVAAACFTIFIGSAGRAFEPFLLRHKLVHLPPIWESLYPARRLRDDVTARLAKIPGKHLVFVKYASGHCFCEEWVFNSADIPEQRIVYARPYTLESDLALARSLSDFDVWVIEPDKHPYNLARLQTGSQWAGLTETDEDGQDNESSR